MNLLEYQAKQLFREIGIPVLPSQCIRTSRELKKLEIPYPVVLKSQVRSGGRGPAGGIRFVANTIDAIAAAQIIFNLPILGEYPNVVLAEARYNPSAELFLAIVLDYELQKPLLLGSAQGGMDTAAIVANLQQVVIEEEFYPFHARHLAIKMGLDRNLIAPVSNIIEKMYYLFHQKDLDIVEINPLGISSTGELMALDGKIVVNRYAWERHPELKSIEGGGVPHRHYWKIINPDGDLVIIGNSLGLVLSCWDQAVECQQNPACYGVVEEMGNNWQSMVQSLQNIEQIKIVWVNIVGNEKLQAEVTSSLQSFSLLDTFEVVVGTSLSICDRPDSPISENS